MTSRAFAKHSSWKRAGAKRARDKRARLSQWAEHDALVWDQNIEEIKLRRAARVTGVEESTADRLARKRAAWRQPAE